MKFVIVPPPFQMIDGRITSNRCSAQIVNTSPQAHVFVNNTVYPVITNSASVPSTQSFIYDPMPDYAEWYGIDFFSCSKMYLTPEDIGNKLWSQREFTDWINANCNSEVLVQRNQSMWTLAFMDGMDYQACFTWYNGLVKKHKFNVKVPADITMYQFGKDIQEWCLQHCTVYKVISGYDGLQVFVKDDEEAVMFKLTWINPV